MALHVALQAQVSSPVDQGRIPLRTEVWLGAKGGEQSRFLERSLKIVGESGLVQLPRNGIFKVHKSTVLQEQVCLTMER